MMLKIARLGSKSSIRTPWVIFSDILNVYYDTIKAEKFTEMTKDSVDENYPFDYCAVIGEPKGVVTVEATRKNGTILYIAFNTVGYLLNDEGKTIEKLNI